MEIAVSVSKTRVSLCIRTHPYNTVVKLPLSGPGVNKDRKCTHMPMLSDLPGLRYVPFMRYRENN